jgi:G3E family GTPase
LYNVNQMAGFYSATMADAPIAELLNIGGFNLQRAVEMKPSFLEPEYPFEWGGIWRLPAGHYRFQFENGPDPDMSFLMANVSDVSEAAVLALAETVFVEFSKATVPLIHGQTMSDVGTCYQLQLEGQEFYEFNFEIESNKEIAIFSQHTPEEFELTLLGQDDTEYTAIAEHYFNAEHEHDDTVLSVSVELPGLFDSHKINAWLSAFLEINGIDIYRMKGVVGVHGESLRFVFQGVHMMFDSQPGEPWGDEPPVNRIVFIGKDLDEKFIRHSLEGCLH